MKNDKTDSSRILARVIGGIVALSGFVGGQAVAGDPTDLAPIVVVATVPDAFGGWALGGEAAALVVGTPQCVMHGLTRTPEARPH